MEAEIPILNKRASATDELPKITEQTKINISPFHSDRMVFVNESDTEGNRYAGNPDYGLGQAVQKHHSRQ